MTIEQEVKEGFYDSVVELFEFDLSDLPNVSGTEHFYFTNTILPNGQKPRWRRSETSSSSQEYEPVPIIASGFDKTTKGQIPQPELQISNIFGLLSELIESLDDLIGVKVIRRRTLAKYLGNFSTRDFDSYFPSDIFYIERKVSETNMAVTFQLASPFDLEGLQIPRRIVTHNHCLWEYRSNICGYGNGRDSDLNGLPVANQLDEVITSSDSTWDDFNGSQQSYLTNLRSYLNAKRVRDQRLQEWNIALGSAEAACDNVTETVDREYQFDSSSSLVDEDDLTFAIVDGDDAKVVVWKGNVVSEGSQYRVRYDKKGSTSGGTANNSIPLRGYEFGGNYNKSGPLTLCIGTQNIGFTDDTNQFFICFNNNSLSFRHAVDVTTNEDQRESSISDLGLREVEEVETEGGDNCDARTEDAEEAETVYTAANTLMVNARAALDASWAALSGTEQDELRDKFDICGKRLTSCQLRFGQSDLPFGGFPGSNLQRE